MIPTLQELRSTMRVVSVPLHSRFRGITQREALLFEGPQGWSEFSPFREYSDEESAAWLAAAIDFAYRPTPAPVRSHIRVNATLPAVTADQVAAVLDRFGSCRTVKVKVAEPGQGLAEDVARVAAVRDYLGAEGRIRVDANGAWNVDEAEHAVHALAQFDLEYLEQPCSSVAELAELRTRIGYMGIPVAADESVRRASDPLAVAAAGGADVLVIKAQPLGGIHAALELAAAAGLPVVVSSALDTSIGISMGLHLASALPELEFDCGLATSSLFVEDVTTDRLIAENGSIAVRRVEPDGSHSADADTREWWSARLERCLAVLEASAD